MNRRNLRGSSAAVFLETWCAARFVHSHACYSYGNRKHVNHSSTPAAIMIIIIIIKHHQTSTINHLELLQVTDIRLFFSQSCVIANEDILEAMEVQNTYPQSS